MPRGPLLILGGCDFLLRKVPLYSNSDLLLLARAGVAGAGATSGALGNTVPRTGVPRREASGQPGQDETASGCARC
jgi:hypothetical protein